jgi:mannose-6-phosphate isomerase-like protein (cupin superfamily)
MTTQIYVGNAIVDGTASRGWLLGYFKPAGDALCSDDVEIKWAIHPQGETRTEWVTGENRSAVLILISGRFRVHLPERSILLTKQGDYVVFHGINHSWHAEQDSVVLAIRWPSIPGFAMPDPTTNTQT